MKDKAEEFARLHNEVKESLIRHKASKLIKPMLKRHMKHIKYIEEGMRLFEKLPDKQRELAEITATKYAESLAKASEIKSDMILEQVRKTEEERMAKAEAEFNEKKT